MENLGQNEEMWSSTWKGSTPEDEIRKWDFYGGRQYISKYVPRYGKTLEAGCGLGRYVFYLSQLGIDIDGIDFSRDTIEAVNQWQANNGYKRSFRFDNVTDLSYEDNSLRGYISLGVIEHFYEGPMKALQEAHRILEPGGIAIITTPSVSWYVRYNRIRRMVAKIAKVILHHESPTAKFKQYEYKPRRLKKFVEDSGLRVTLYTNYDILLTFAQFFGYSVERLGADTWAYWFSHKFENSVIKSLGAQSIVIAVKLSSVMYCFLCGERSAQQNSLLNYTVPICSKCASSELAKYYKIGTYARFAAPYLINPSILEPEQRVCAISRKQYTTDENFEDYGFSTSVSPSILQDPCINIKLCNEHIQPIWRS